MRVLVADDHPFVRAGLEAVLSRASFEIVASVGNGTEALKAIGETDPDVAVLDVVMPGLDGIEVLEKMREGGDFRPVVLLTAMIDDNRLLRAVRGKVNGIVLKEGAEDRLVACLHSVRAGHRSIEPALMQRALDLSLNPPPEGPLEGLAPREKEIARLVATGMRNRDVAKALAMTEGTVKFYLHGIYEKVGVSTRTELALLLAGQNA